MTNLFARLGAVGLSLIAGALIFGALAGGVVVHRLQVAQTAASSQQEQGDQENAGNHGQSRSKHPNHGHSKAPKSNDDQGEQDKDA